MIFAVALLAPAFGRVLKDFAVPALTTPVEDEDLGCLVNGVAVAPYCIGANCCNACCSNAPLPTLGWCCSQTEYDELEELKTKLQIRGPVSPVPVEPEPQSEPELVPAKVEEEDLGCLGNGVAVPPYCIGADCCNACCSAAPLPTLGWCCAQEEYDELEALKAKLSSFGPSLPTPEPEVTTKAVAAVVQEEEEEDLGCLGNGVAVPPYCIGADCCNACCSAAPLPTMGWCCAQEEYDALEALKSTFTKMGPAALQAPEPAPVVEATVETNVETAEEDDEELGCLGNGVAVPPYCIGADCCNACCSAAPLPTMGWCCAQEEYDALEDLKSKMQLSSEPIFEGCDFGACADAVTKCAKTCVASGLLSADCETCMGNDWNLCSQCIPIDATQKVDETDSWVLGDPAGTYSGSKDILGQDIEATVAQVDSSHISLTVSGAASVDCGSEPYTYSNGVIYVTNANTPGDCVYEALNDADLSLKTVTYDSGSDTITVTVSHGLFITVDIELTKSGEVTGEENLGCLGNGVAVPPYCIGADCCNACCSAAPLPTMGWCCAQEEYDALEQIKALMSVQGVEAGMQ